MRIVKVVLLSILLVFVSITWVMVANSNKITNYRTITGFDLKNYEIGNFDSEKKLVDVNLEPTANAVECGMLEDGDKVVFQKVDDNHCLLKASVDNNLTVYFKDRKNNISKAFVIDNYVVNINLKDKYYLPLDTTLDLLSNVVKVGNPNIEIRTDSPAIEIIENTVHTVDNGVSKVEVVNDGKVIASTTIVSTDVIVSRPQIFNLDKKYLSCKEYNGEKAKLLDEILRYRIDEVGDNTRAAAVEVARFITLEFPRRIAYYWENGRLYKTGRHYVDGEGRYYHKGLYLDESKYNDIVASMQGPQMWGCKMINWQDDPPDFYRNLYYPNGLDCSGFVSWVLLNGGFDVGDKGAGPIGGANDLTDLGDMKYLSDSLINSGVIKVGDLFSTNGHISILVGIDDEHFYIAESLNHYGGVVMRKYRKTRVRSFFQRVVLMDNVYKKDGKLTNMWY